MNNIMYENNFRSTRIGVCFSSITCQIQTYSVKLKKNLKKKEKVIQLLNYKSSNV